VGFQPPSLSNKEVVVLYAETRLLAHDPLFISSETEFRSIPQNPVFVNREAVTAAGLRRTMTLIHDATLRHSYRGIWGGAKPSHTGPHGYPGCIDNYTGPGDCSAYDPDYWKKHPEKAGYDAFAAFDAILEAKWAEEFSNPGHPLPPGVVA
jgi:hypothetical protein